MADSIRELALAAAFARLQTIVGAAKIERNWNGSPNSTQMPAVIMMDGGEVLDEELIHNYQFTLPIYVNLFLTAADTDAIGPVMSLWIQKVKEALLFGDLTLSNTCRDIRYVASTDPLTDDELGGTPFRFIGMQFDLLIEHALTDPTTKV